MVGEGKRTARFSGRRKAWGKEGSPDVEGHTVGKTHCLPGHTEGSLMLAETNMADRKASLHAKCYRIEVYPVGTRHTTESWG